MTQQNGRSPHTGQSATGSNGNADASTAPPGLESLLHLSVRLAGTIGAAGLAVPAAVGSALGGRLPRGAPPAMDDAPERPASLTIFVDDGVEGDAGPVLDSRHSRA